MSLDVFANEIKRKSKSNQASIEQVSVGLYSPSFRRSIIHDL